MKQNTRQKGSLRWFVLLVIGLLVASFYFDVDVKKIVEDEKTQKNIHYIQTHVVGFYNEHLSSHVNYVWEKVFKDLIWESFVQNMEQIKKGEMTDIEKAAPGVSLSE